ncbi:regulator of acetyl CoA synthetase [Pandoraea cepalis]|uniref:Regulator of acetyl CoA synthetase n=1 Tax=Pandoraea cepalis TaxID=2508294 RepID=A0AAW7MGN8_9BURK|nr:SMEK domain-containing protein [Pandoraea cepalis]MDN4571841.1 regulator of acetyl CoA synthetase [Pandoraea cepalis]MDN4581295.1 regulator of acetyl CoA synthetase [Pandoraea cepalis]
MLEALIKNLSQDIAVMQRHIELGKDAGFNDTSRLLEVLTIQFFKSLGIADLVRTDQLRTNFPAIDAADKIKSGGIAVQVTSVADAAKVKKTIDAFEKKAPNGTSIKDSFAKLYIFGFCKHTKRAKVPTYCEVIGPGFLVDRLVDLGDEVPVQEISDAIRRHLDYRSIHPYDDVACLRIALGYISRNAVRHFMSCEGDVNDMTRGLNEITELIGKGTVNRKEKSKAHHEFLDDNIASFLRFVMDQIGRITAIVNRRRLPGRSFVCLEQGDMQAIDELKQSIASSAQSIATTYGVSGIHLGMHKIN